MTESPEPQYTPEQEILLWAIRVDHTKDQRIAEVLRSGVNWRYIRETALRHGIIPLLYTQLKAEMVDLVPKDEFAGIKTLFISNGSKNLQMTQHLLKILDVLAASGIEAMPFKGPALAVQAYGDLVMRSYVDLDLLIHPNDLSKASRILNEQGYTEKIPIGAGFEEFLRRSKQKDLQFFSDDLLLELHWRIIERLYAVPLNMDQVWNRSLPISIHSRQIKTLFPEDMAIILCFHGLKHDWQDLALLGDLIYMISKHPEIDWRGIVSRCEEIGLKRIVLLGLHLAQLYGGIRLRDEVVELLASDSTVRPLAGLFQIDFSYIQKSETPYPKPFFYIKLRERYRDKVIFMINFFIDKSIIPPLLKLHRELRHIT
jgi:hypothetical protein